MTTHNLRDSIQRLLDFQSTENYKLLSDSDYRLGERILPLGQPFRGSSRKIFLDHNWRRPVKYSIFEHKEIIENVTGL